VRYSVRKDGKYPWEGRTLEEKFGKRKYCRKNRRRRKVVK
jgi:hypothetical protein